MKCGLTVSMIFEAESANYGEGFGNITVLKKMTRGDGNVYSYISRQALRYNLVQQLGWNNTPVRAEGKGDNKVVQFDPTATIDKWPEIDLFGYMKTKPKERSKDKTSESDQPSEAGGADTRPAVARLSHAISLEPFQADMDFLTNIDLARRALGTLNNIAQSEIHRSLYAYTLTVDLDRVGVDKDISIPIPERIKRVKDLLTAAQFLYRDIRGRRENLAPVFVVGGVYARKNPFFLNRLKVNGRRLDVELLKETIEPIRNDTSVGCLSGIFDNEQQIRSELHAVKIEEAFDRLRGMVEEAYKDLDEVVGTV